MTTYIFKGSISVMNDCTVEALNCKSRKKDSGGNVMEQDLCAVCEPNKCTGYKHAHTS